MARINRIKMSHGTKMVKQHLNSSLGEASDQLAEANIEANQIAPNRNVFYINWSIPSIKTTWGEKAYCENLENPFSFILPPTQELFNSYFQTQEALITLDEFMFSWDQNANPVAYTDIFQKDQIAPPPAVDTQIKVNAMFDGVADNYKVRIRLYEKTPIMISQVADSVPETIVYQLEIEPNAFLSTKYRNNPVIQSSLGIPINPYKSYVMTISFPLGLEQDYPSGEDDISVASHLPGVNIRAKFSSKLLQADEGDFIPQNSPLIHDMVNQYPPQIVDPTWNAGDPILAEDQGGYFGIQTAIDNIDTLTNIGYKGGLTKTSDILPNSTIKDMYGYDVICVPLFGLMEGVRRDMFYNGSEKDFMPYIVAGNPQPKWSVDRRLIHLSHPFIIHHIFLSMSFMANKTALLVAGNPVASTPYDVLPGIYRPFASTISREVGVFVASGIRSDDYDWQQVGYLQADPAYNQYVVDKTQIVGVDGNPDGWGSINEFGDRVGAYDTELWQVPINYGSSRTGYGFDENGTPFFAGRSNRRTANRTDCFDLPFDFGGTASPVRPNTLGRETWIEIRGKISEPDEEKWLGEDGNDEILVGRGGWYVYLIGKRALTY